jgi:hypothetical protein
VKKRLLVVAMTAIALFGVGSGLAPADAKTPPPPTSINANAGLCTHIYGLNFGYCWYGLF